MAFRKVNTVINLFYWYETGKTDGFPKACFDISGRAGNKASLRSVT